MAIDILIIPAPSGSTVFNTTGTYTQGVLTGYDLTLPNTPIFSTLSGFTSDTPSVSTGYTIPDNIYTDSDGSTGHTSEYGQVIVCTPVAPDPTVSLVFYSDSGLTTTITGTTFGSTVYVKANTNITATSYDFLVPQRDGHYVGTNQVSDTYTWVTDAIGAVYFSVSATDGSVSPFNSAAFTVASTYILDTYTTATAAFSVRRLRSAYTGYCMNVRRSSDNTSMNLGFVNDMLDVATLLAFVGTGNGFVSTWYDQSTTASNATQSTANNQPLIVSNGVLNEVNDIPAILFGGILYATYNSFTVSNRTFKTGFCVARKSTNGVQYVPLLGFASDYVVQMGGANTSLRIESPVGNVESTLNNFRLNQMTLLTGTGGTGRIRGNGVQYGSGSANSTSVMQRIGVNTSSTSRYFIGVMLELITFPDDQTANFTAIEANQMNYFNT